MIDGYQCSVSLMRSQKQIKSIFICEALFMVTFLHLETKAKTNTHKKTYTTDTMPTTTPPTLHAHNKA